MIMMFKNPEYLWLLLLLVPMIFWYVFKLYQKDASLQMSSISSFKNLPKTNKQYLFHMLFGLRVLALSLLVLVVARPQTSNTHSSSTTHGIDIVISLDVSGTMLAEDLRPNRLEAAKNLGIEFIAERPNDNIGLVVFAGESFSQCPLTSDHGSLMNLFKSVDFGMIEDGTAIGLGLANSVNRLKDSKAKSKVVILLTDGTNNTGDVAPITAAEIAATYGIRVYTIGVGTEGMAPYPFHTPLGVQYQNIPVEIDEETLAQIADITGGGYFRATDNSKLKSVYEEIDLMEKTKLQVREYSKTTEDYMPYLILAMLLLLMEVVLRNTLVRRLP